MKQLYTIVPLKYNQPIHRDLLYKKYNAFNKNLILACLFAIGVSMPATAQSENEEENNKISIRFDKKKGLGLTTADNFFSTNFRFRMQNRFTVLRKENTTYDANIRKLRFRFDGHILSPKFTYKIQLSLAPDDLKYSETDESLAIVRDLILQYQHNENWVILFGQTKLPGNRQQENSSGNLQLTDRSINNSKFRIEPDLGIQVHYKDFDTNQFSYAVKSAISTGKGIYKSRNTDNSYALTGKIEFYPLGTFTEGGAYFEGDLVREPNPKLLVSGAFNHSQNALWSQGLQGMSLYEARDIQSAFVDILFKYEGWAAMLAYLNRNAKSPMTQSDLNPNLQAFVYTGHGMDYQLSYIFPKDYEVSGRFSDQKVQNILYQHNLPHTKQWSLGLTKYIWKHKIKWQTELSYQEEDYLLKPTKDSWYLRFQMEVGI